MRGRAAPGRGGTQGTAKPVARPTREVREGAPHHPTQSETLHNLQNPRGRGPTHAGAEIRRDMEGLMDDYYDEATTCAPPPPARGAPANGPSPMFKGATTCVQINPAWFHGPKAPEGRMFDASDSNLLCMDVLGDLAVVGSADHGLKVFNVRSGRETRNLYGKRCGHTEWVTSCCFLHDKRILSGGMDSKLCLWHASALRCDDMLGHTGSVSQVSVNQSDIAVSASYDRTVRVWDCQRKSEIATLKGPQGLRDAVHLETHFGAVRRPQR